MNPLKLFAAAAIVGGLPAVGVLPDGARAAESAAGTAPAAHFSDQQIIAAWGWRTAQEQNVAGIELNEAERAAFLRGASAEIEGRPAPYDLGSIHPDVDKLAERRREKITRAFRQKNLAAAAEFFAVLQKKAGVIRLPSGLRYEVINPGSGPVPQPQQTVRVHYIGHLIDGTEFVQMDDYDMVLVPNRVSPALFEGLQKIAAGGRIKLYVPPPLPPEEEARLGVPSGSAIVYEVELSRIQATAPDDLANSLLPPAPETPPPPPSGFTEMQVIETWGWTVARQTGAADLLAGAVDRQEFVQGFAAGIAAQPPAVAPDQIQSVVREFVADRREKVRRAVQAKRREEMNALFAGLKKNPRVVELPDGLRYEVLHPGTGPFPQPGQIVIVDYTGRLLDGKVFDRTDNEPLHIAVGSVIPGWNEGIQKINRGGSIRLYIPPSIGYGDENMSGVIASIPAESALVYEIKLLDIEEAAPEGGAAEPAKK